MGAKIHAIKNDLPGNRRLWCGPAAVAGITGVPVSTIMELFRSSRGGRQVRGVYYWEVATVLKKYGLLLESIPIDHGVNFPTLAMWLRQNYKELAEGIFLIQVTRHYVVAHGRKLVDSNYPETVFLRKAKRVRRKRVRKVFRVREKNAVS